MSAAADGSPTPSPVQPAAPPTSARWRSAAALMGLGLLVVTLLLRFTGGREEEKPPRPGLERSVSGMAQQIKSNAPRASRKNLPAIEVPRVGNPILFAAAVEAKELGDLFATPYAERAVAEVDSGEARFSRDGGGGTDGVEVELHRRYSGLLGGASGAGGAAPAPATSSQFSATRSRLEEPHLAAGTFVPVVTAHEISTEVPSIVVASVTRDVWDSTAGTVLIPAGSRVLGRLDAQPSLDQSRVPLRWETLELPDGTRVTLPDGQAATADGTAGATGKVSRRLALRFGSAVGLALTTSLAAGAQHESGSERDSLSSRGLVGAEVASRLGQSYGQILERLLEVPNIIRLRAGTRLLLITTDPIVFGDRP